MLTESDMLIGACWQELGELEGSPVISKGNYLLKWMLL